MLCLCPDHHVLLDEGTVTINDDLVAIDLPTGEPIGPLRRVARHRLELRHLAYHRELWATPTPSGPTAST
ncbi:hypothetical protein Sru01_40940 [Sphaerisporangium rufum]|uniref:HNH endonuclease n=1 Tax=Sphaerisporangium rufum TaxID=1381558 RepID=A0A919R3P5_9ACTN|nr:hypothetical protein Sru01_40940 [Sphaerisporangium rufum]